MRVEQILFNDFRGVDNQTMKFDLFTKISGGNQTSIIKGVELLLSEIVPAFQPTHKPQPYKNEDHKHSWDGVSFIKTPPRLHGEFIDEDGVNFTIWKWAIETGKTKTTPFDITSPHIKPVIASYNCGGNLFVGTRKPSEVRRTRAERGYDGCLSLTPINLLEINGWLYEYPRNNKLGMDFDGLYDVFMDTVNMVMNPFGDVCFDTITDGIVFKDKNTEVQLPLSLQSGCIKIMLGIVCDMTYRCVVLNGSQENNAVKLTDGVVLIDNLRLLGDYADIFTDRLRSAFPKIQFIIAI